MIKEYYLKVNTALHPRLKFLFALFILSSIISIELYHKSQKLENKQQAITQTQTLLHSLGARLEAIIHSDILTANSLSTYLMVNPQADSKQWLPIAKEVVRQSRTLSIVSVAPNDVIRTVTPIYNNEQFIGFRYKDVPELWQSVLEAKSTKRPIIRGPIDLDTHGQAIIIRIPVFNNPPLHTHYWGNLSLVLNWDTLLHEAGVHHITDQYQFIINKNQSTYAARSSRPNYTFFTDHHQDDRFSVKLTIGDWTISLTPKESFYTDHLKNSSMIRKVLYPVLILITLAFVIIYRLYNTANLRSLQDDLTQLPNRRYLMYTLRKLAEHTKKTKSVFTIFNIDLNGFKQINDTYGHAVGDIVLVEVASRLNQALRGTDTVARMGGDEFIVLVPRVGIKTDIDVIRYHLQHRVENTPIVAGEHSIKVSCCIGYSIFMPDKDDIDELLRKADERMYKRKIRHHLINSSTTEAEAL